MFNMAWHLVLTGPTRELKEGQTHRHTHRKVGSGRLCALMDPNLQLYNSWNLCELTVSSTRRGLARLRRRSV